MSSNVGSASACIHPSCRNRTTNPDGLCYAHSHLGISVTPRGQVGLRGTSHSPVDFSTKLAKEQAHPVPSDSVGIPGFPYFTQQDMNSYVAWREGDAPEIDLDIVMDRFPISAPEILGSEFRGDEIAVYDSDGALYTLVRDTEGKPVIIDETDLPDGAFMMILQTQYGLPYAVRSDQRYQVLRLDSDTLDKYANKD